MAQKVQVLLVDDLDGSEADETVTFGMDGVTYEIDLKAATATKLRKALAPYVEAGRRTGGRAARGKAKSGATSNSTDVWKIREWARSSGYEINERGRIPETVRAAYDKAH